MCRQKEFTNTERGFGIVEILVAVGVLAVIVVAVLKWIGGAGSLSQRLQGGSACQIFANTLVDTIKTHDNATYVRSWMPATSRDPLKVGPIDPNDPVCPPGAVGVRCDSLPVFEFNDANLRSVDVTGSPKLATFQNIRGAGTWAHNLYNNLNTEKDPVICRADDMTGGLRFQRERNTLELLNRYLMKPVDSMPSFVKEVRLRIRPMGRAQLAAKPDVVENPCGMDDIRWTRANPVQFQIDFMVHHDQMTNDKGGMDTHCSASIKVGISKDDAAPVLSPTPWVTNGDDDTIPQHVVGEPSDGDNQNIHEDQCTCRKKWPDRAQCTDQIIKTVKVTATAVEPGSLFFCRRTYPPATALNPEEGVFRYCGDVGSGVSLLVGPTPPPDAGKGTAVAQPTAYAANQSNTSVRFSITKEQLSDGSSWGYNTYEVAAVDAAGNSKSTFIGFNIRRPQCNPATLCTGVVVDDGCNNDCPPGTDTGTCPGKNPCTPNGGDPVTGTCEKACGVSPKCPNPCDEIPKKPDCECEVRCNNCSDPARRKCVRGDGDGCKIPDPTSTATPRPLVCAGDDVLPTPTPSCTPAPYGTVVKDPTLCCGTGVYMCKERTAKWIKDWKYDRYCCVHDDCPRPFWPYPREDLDDYMPEGSCLYNCTPSNKWRPACWLSPKTDANYVCLGKQDGWKPGDPVNSAGLIASGPNCVNLQWFCRGMPPTGVPPRWSHWFSDVDGGKGPYNWNTCQPYYMNMK